MERDLYEPVRSEIESRFKTRFRNCHLEVTAEGKFSDNLKEKVKHDIVSSFIRRARVGGYASPDLTGFSMYYGKTNFITVEIKDEELTLDNVYQAKKYADLFSAKYGFLISSEAIPTELKKLHKAVSILDHEVEGSSTSDGWIYLARVGGSSSIPLAKGGVDSGYTATPAPKIMDDSWFPANPFRKAKRRPQSDSTWGF